MRANRPSTGFFSLSTVALFSLLTACGGGEESSSTPETAPAAAAEAPAAPAGLTEAMRAAASEEHLVPSPGEMQAAMSSAGIQTTLASLVSTREMDMSNPNKDHIAVRTGVVLADLLLTVSDADKADTVSRFKQIREGLSLSLIHI